MLTIPDPLRIEHEELHRELARAIQMDGRVGAIARQVADLLRPHFVREEEFALPPLAALADLAAGKHVTDASEIINMSERLKVELPMMLSEHRTIVASLERLVTAANEEGHPEIAGFAEKLKLHARTEEDVFYPAAVLVGEYLKSALPSKLTPARWPERTN